MKLSKAALCCALITSVAMLTSDALGADAAAAKNPVVTIKTSMGAITAELFADKAPVSTKNFLEYAKAGYFDGTIFHRVIGNFMIQGGGMDATLKPKAGQRGPIKNEADNGIKNTRGTLAMARTSAPDSATAQWFINVKDNGFLDHRDETPQGYGYAVFGKVTEGMDVVDAIKEVPTGNRDMYQDVPTDDVTIQTVTIESNSIDGVTVDGVTAKE
jgi:cyclophilin family peptidyl-prolyl cis-trans isomerase